MKRSLWTRILALILVVSMLAVPVSASGWSSRNNRSGWGWGWGSIWDYWFGGSQKEEPEPTEATEPETGSDAELILVEDQSTVDNGELLRASTYSLTTTEESAGTNAANTYSLMAADTDAQAEGTTVKYFPVTMYDYDQNTIRSATNKIEVEAGVGDTWNGMYFSGGSPAATTYSTSGEGGISFDENNNALIPDGEYLIYSSGNGKYVTNSVGYSAWGTYTLSATSTASEATSWTVKKQDDGSYTIQDSEGMYMNISGENASGLSLDPVYMSIYKDGESVVVKKLNADNTYCYLNALGGSSYSNFGGWSSGSPISFTASEGSVSLGYAAHNHWNKASGNNSNGDLIWTGLVKDTMVNDQVVFNVPDAGIFNDDTSIKSIYEYVGLPFVLDKETGVYSFDSDVNGVYFAGTPQSGTIDENGKIAAHNLHFAEGAPQPMPSGLSVGDGSTNAFLPFNNQASYNTSDVNYHFGMRADLPFSMTANGRVKSTDDTSAPITFTFSGDDDVWVFIDGHLVIDLGGIHNRLDVTIDFANNTITYSEENAQDTDNATASYNNADFAMTQQLFTVDGVEGVIPQTRDAFALDQDHEMQVFYLERGEGTSNCRIEFNLPMNDTVIVTKDATQSWSSTTDEVDQLTAAEQAIVNNVDFGFTLYKKAADEGFTPVANTNFYLVGRAVEGVVINQTDASGHFYLKNGQSAKFITDIPGNGVTYYVVEDQVPKGFVSPDFNFAGEAAYDYSYTDGETTGTAPATDASQIPEQIIPLPEEDEDGNVISWPVNKSYEVTVKGSVEAPDSIEFICSNYLDAELPNPTALAYEDIIVIDYGLPVNIDPLANDVFRGDSIEIIAVGGADLTMDEKNDDNGNGVYEEAEQTIHADDTYDFGTVQFNDKTYAVDSEGNVTRDTLTYTLNKQLTKVEILTYVVKVTGQEKQEATGEVKTQYDYAVGKIYIVPATVMYYEENFSDLVTFNNGKGAWDANATTDASAVSPYQEPGVVGTTGDSTYGSDVAYLSDSTDSNGTSRHGDTTDGAIQFTYSFTGTGTSFFARTSATTGYMQVKVYKGIGTSGEVVDLTYRDTYYKDTNGTDEDGTGILYNIPVYTQEDLDYGTYTVVATVAKAGTKGAGALGDDGYQHSGKDFYLDGIRIVQPLNESNEIVLDEETGETITDKALGAYATDGEANVDIVTLRYKLITDAEEGNNAWNFVVLTDTNGEIKTAEEYTSIGPKEEVYLMPGQSVSFAIKFWHKDGYLMHLGMKAPFGTGTAQVGQKTYELKNATDCYYNITDTQGSIVTATAEDGSTYYVATYTISATDKIVSLTNLKLTGNYEFALIENIDKEVDGSVGGEE